MIVSDSPYRLTSLIVAGSLLSVAGLICGSLRSVYASLPLLIICFATAVIGAAVMYWASYLLRAQVQSERWPEMTLVPFRRVVEHVFWKIGMGALLMAMLTSLIQVQRHRPWFWIVFLLLQTQTQISAAFAHPRKPLDMSSRPDWSQIKPLYSEHWRNQ